MSALKAPHWQEVDPSLPERALRAGPLMGGGAAVGARSAGQEPADLGPSGSLQLPVRAMLLEGELGTEA